MENRERASQVNDFFMKNRQIKEINVPKVNERGTVVTNREDVLNKKDNFSVEKNGNLVTRILDRLVGLSIFMLFFGASLYFSGLVSQGIIFEKQLFFYFWLLLGLVVWVVKGVVSGEINIRRTPLDFPILGFWIIYVIATIFSIDRWHSFWGSFSDPSRGLLSITAYIVAYYFILNNFNVKRLRLILFALISSGTILMIWALLTAFGIVFLPKNLISYAPLSLTGSITSLSVVLSVLVPIITAVILRITNISYREFIFGKITKNMLISFLMVILALDLFLILIFYNYIFWLGLFAGIAMFSVFILAKIMRPKVGWLWLPMALFILVMIFRMIGAIPIAKVVFPVEVSLSSQTSTHIIKESIKNNFMIGSGPASYGYSFSKYRPVEFNSNALYKLRFFQGTGILAEAIPTIGIFGVFFLIVLLLSCISLQIYLLYRGKERNKLYSLGVTCASIILITNVLFVRVDGFILMLTVLVTTLSLATIFLESGIGEDSFNFSLKASPKFALTFAFIFVVIVTGVAFIFIYLGKVYVADIYAQKANKTISKDPNKAINYLGKTIQLNNQESKYYTQLGEYYMIFANQEINKNKDGQNLDTAFQYLNKSIANANQGKIMSGNDIGTIESLALIYENTSLYVADSMGFAEENYKKALELEPHNPVYYLKLGQIKISIAQKEKDVASKKALVKEAKEFFKQSIEKKNDYAEGYFQLALTHEALDELDQAVESATRAVQLNSKNVNYLISLGRMHQQRDKKGDNELAQKYYEKVISLNSNDVSGHFYIGLLYEKNGKRDEAKTEYKKIINILKSNYNNQDNSEVIEKLEKMIDNIDNRVENNPENLDLIPSASENQEFIPQLEEVDNGAEDLTKTESENIDKEDSEVIIGD